MGIAINLAAAYLEDLAAITSPKRANPARSLPAD
jgi:hypothetical protein